MLRIVAFRGAEDGIPVTVEITRHRPDGTIRVTVDERTTEAVLPGRDFEPLMETLKRCQPRLWPSNPFFGIGDYYKLVIENEMAKAEYTWGMSPPEGWEPIGEAFGYVFGLAHEVARKTKGFPIYW